MGDLQAKVFGTLPDETWFYPGHGNDSTLGRERPGVARPPLVAPAIASLSTRPLGSGPAPGLPPCGDSEKGSDGWRLR